MIYLVIYVVKGRTFCYSKTIKLDSKKDIVFVFFRFFFASSTKNCFCFSFLLFFFFLVCFFPTEKKNMHVILIFSTGIFARSPSALSGIWKTPRARWRALGVFKIPSGLLGDLGEDPLEKTRITYIYFYGESKFNMGHTNILIIFVWGGIHTP